MVRGGKFAPWLGTQIGTGAYGVAFSSKYSRELYGVLGALTHTITAQRGMPRVGAGVVVKLSVYNAKKNYEQWLHGCLREAAVHKLASDLPSIRLKSVRDVNPAAHVPAFYLAGLFEDPYTGASIFVTVMSLAPGVSIGKWLKTHALDVGTFLKVERAAASLWLGGIVHADLHEDNVMYDGQRVTIIDFGFAVVLTEEQTRRVQAVVLASFVKDALALNENTLGHVNRVQAGRGAPWYHDDNSLLADLREKLSVDAATLQAERRRLWGFKAPRTLASMFRRRTAASKI